MLDSHHQQHITAQYSSTDCEIIANRLEVSLGKLSCIMFEELTAP